MKRNQFTLSDITADLIEHADMYMKKVLINTKRRYFRKLRKIEKNGVTILELEKYETNLIYEEMGFEKADTTYFDVNGNPIPITKTELAEALLCLTELQLQILLKSEVLELTPDELAKEYGISKRMLRKHRHIALEKLRKKMDVNYEE